MRTAIGPPWNLYAWRRYFTGICIRLGMSCALRCCVERPVNEVRFGSDVGVSAGDEVRMTDDHVARTYPTPVEFVGQLGRVIAYCLGLAVLAHVIVAIVGS
jgi:hypothetical protein